MNGLDEPHTRTRTAVILSIAAHLCALLVLAELLADARFPRAASTDNGTGPAVTMFVRREHAPRLPAVRSAAPLAVAVRPTASPVERHRLPRTPPAESTGRVRPTVRHARPVQHHPSGAGRLALAIAAPAASTAPLPMPTRVHTSGLIPLLIDAPTPAPTALPTSAPTPLPTTAPTNTPAAVAAGSFGGLFSQNYPPAFTTAAELAAIRSRLNRPVHIRVDVDETGRATDVHFVEPVKDTAAAQEVRTALLALRYVPADCNGLHCEGTLEITF